jgi:transposase
MKSSRYTAEFKSEAVKQVTDRGHGVVEVATRLGISDKSLYLWLRQSREPTVNHQDVSALNKELNRMRAELKRTTEERDILKKAAAYFAKLSD